MNRLRMRNVLALGCIPITLWGCSQMDTYLKIGSKSDNPSASHANNEGQAQSGTSSSEPDTPPSYVDVWLDGQKAQKRSGTALIAKPIGVRPKLRYEITDPGKLGKVNSTIINVFASTGDGWSSTAAFVILATGGEMRMSPDVEYNLGAAGDDLMIMDRDNKKLSGLKLDSGKKYLMNFVVSADQSETVSIEFTTR